MKNKRFTLIDHPWLFLLVFIFAAFVCQILIGLLLVIAFKLPLGATVTNFWVMLLGNLLLLFIVVPFVLAFPQRMRPYATYLSEIRLTHVKPVLRLIVLGISCYLILALSQVAGVLIYRLTQGQQIDASFFRSAFIFANELPPRSMNWLYSLPSILEEVAFRGVILALFLRFYKQPKAVLFSALGFGVSHLGNLLSGGDPVLTAGQAIWAAILGLFYGYVTLKTDSLLPAMIVHYLGNLFVSALNAYLQNNASIPVQVFYGITFTLGVIPVVLMSLWVRVFTSWWPMKPKHNLYRA
jgi:membrane protease YdiL (CAAX protease family)